MYLYSDVISESSTRAAYYIGWPFCEMDSHVQVQETSPKHHMWTKFTVQYVIKMRNKPEPAMHLPLSLWCLWWWLALKRAARLSTQIDYVLIFKDSQLTSYFFANNKCTWVRWYCCWDNKWGQYIKKNWIRRHGMPVNRNSNLWCKSRRQHRAVINWKKNKHWTLINLATPSPPH